MLRKYLFGNLRIKGMALVMAIALWFYAINKYTGEITENIQLEIHSPPGLTTLEVSSDLVTVSLSGPQHVIERVTGMIKDNMIRARCDFLDTSEIIEGNFTKTIRLTKRNFEFPREIRLISVVPNEISVTFGRLQSKHLKVQIQKKGNLPHGYEITSEFFYPHEVLVKGTENVLKDAESINTKPIDVSRLTSEQNRTFPWTVEIEQSISLINDDKYVSKPVSCREKIKVWFQISEKLGIREIEKVKVHVLHPLNYNFDVKLKEEFVNLSLKGPQLILDGLVSTDITAYIDVGPLNLPGPYKQPVICKIPDGLEMEGASPEVFVDIVEETTDTKVE